MFAVVTIAFPAVITALVGSELVHVGRRSSRNIGIHVPHRAIGFVVGGIKSGPDIAVRFYCVVFDDVVEGCLEFGPGFSGGGIVISRGDLGKNPGNKKEQDYGKRRIGDKPKDK